MRRVLVRPGRPTRRGRRWTAAAAVLAAPVCCAAVVWRSAYATFDDAAPSDPVTFSTGSVSLGDDDAGTTMFTVSGLAPGAAGTRCITVTSTGSVPAPVRMYVTGRSTTKSLASNLTLDIQSGTGGSTADCAGFTPATTVYRGTLAAFPTGFGSGVGGWTTTGNTVGESRTYQITYSVPANAPATSQAGTAAVTFTWETQSQGRPR